MIKAIVFDVDGVLLESAEIKTEAFQSLFSDYPEHLEAILQHHLRNGGMSRYDKIHSIYRDILKRPISEQELASLCHRFREIVFQSILNCPVVPGALEFLERHFKDYICFIITATPQEEIEEIIARRGLLGYFKTMYGAPTLKEEALANILQKYSLNQEEVVYIGDSLNDYEAARKLGIRFIGRLHRENQGLLYFLETRDKICDLSGLGQMLQE